MWSIYVCVHQGTIALICFAVGSCRLRAMVQTNQGNHSQEVRQTQLQLLCDSGNCPPTNLVTCDAYYMDLDILSSGTLGH